MQYQLSEATAAQRRWFFVAVDDTDGKTAETGLTFSGAELQISKNGAAYASFAGSATELSDGTYYYEATAGELDTVGMIGFKIEKTGVRTTVMQVGQVVPWDPYDAVRLGMTALPNANASVVGGLIVLAGGSSTNGLVVDADGAAHVDARKHLGTAYVTPTTAGVPEVDVTHFAGTAAVMASGFPVTTLGDIRGAAISGLSAASPPIMRVTPNTPFSVTFDLWQTVTFIDAYRWSGNGDLGALVDTVDYTVETDANSVTVTFINGFPVGDNFNLGFECTAGGFNHWSVREIQIIEATTAGEIRDAILDYVHDNGGPIPATVRGLLIRLEALASGKATGLISSLARFFMQDNVTVATETIQDTATGSRSRGDISGSE